MAARPGLRIVTFNIWFGDYHWAERATALCTLLKSLDADVIALQELTPRVLKVLLDQPWAGSYEFSARSSEPVTPYGTLLMARGPILSFTRKALFSHQGRCLDLVRFVDGTSVATVHLESRSTAELVRCQQLDEIFGRDDQGRALSEHHPQVLVGDFNCVPGSVEEASIPAGFIDAWPSHRDRAAGHTVDTDVNTLAWMQKNRSKRQRIDRIFIDGARWCVNDDAIERIGVSPFESGSGEQMWISDHFGLCADLVRRSPGDGAG